MLATAIEIDILSTGEPETVAMSSLFSLDGRHNGCETTVGESLKAKMKDERCKEAKSGSPEVLMHDGLSCGVSDYIFVSANRTVTECQTY